MGGDGIEFYVRDHNGDKLSLGLADVAEDKASITFGIFNDDNKDVTLKPIGFSITEALLSISILEAMKQNDGIPPTNLPGSPAKANKYNYQKEYALALSEGLSEGQAMDGVIRNISFGKHRQNIGYGDIEAFPSSDMTAVTHNASGELLDAPLENVPKGVGVKNAKLTDQSKLDQTLAKYEEAYKSGRE